MFRGRYEHAIDAKGRLQLPAAVRRALKKRDVDELILTPHISSPCLVAYTPAEWGRFEQRIAALPQFEPSVMALRRLYVGGAMECALDKLGRIVVPPPLRTAAALEQKVFWVGAISTLEIWAVGQWDAHVEAQRDKVGPEVLQKLAELGL